MREDDEGMHEAGQFGGMKGDGSKCEGRGERKKVAKAGDRKRIGWGSAQRPGKDARPFLSTPIRFDVG